MSEENDTSSATDQSVKDTGITAGERPWFNGMFIGQLDADDLRQFERDCERGIARRTYETFSAKTLGLATVRYL